MARPTIDQTIDLSERIEWALETGSLHMVMACCGTSRIMAIADAALKPLIRCTACDSLVQVTNEPKPGFTEPLRCPCKCKRIQKHPDASLKLGEVK